MKPVMYLDIDGVLWDVDEAKVSNRVAMEDAYKGAEGVLEFITFALENFEVRWLTWWAARGGLLPWQCETLSEYTSVSAEVWAKVKPSRGFYSHKLEGIQFYEGRHFVWIDDECTTQEATWLLDRDELGSFFHTDIFEDPQALIKTHEKLKEWLHAL